MVEPTVSRTHGRGWVKGFTNNSIKNHFAETEVRYDKQLLAVASMAHLCISSAGCTDDMSATAVLSSN